MKYIEAGIGNRWWIRTETELEDGTEVEEPGLVGPIRIRSVYVRCWVGRTVVLWDSKDGWKKVRKSRRAWKFLLGVVSW